LLDDPAGLARLGETAALGPDPDRRARRAEAWAVIRDVLEHELTDRQRQALRALLVEDVPLDELARHWRSNRNAIYKLVHDARRRLKARLEARGFPPGEILELFAGPG
jgi:RNA polymerase sigma-70 factor (ECF subfamily)